MSDQKPSSDKNSPSKTSTKTPESSTSTNSNQPIRHALLAEDDNTRQSPSLAPDRTSSPRDHTTNPGKDVQTPEADRGDLTPDEQQNEFTPRQDTGDETPSNTDDMNPSGDHTSPEEDNVTPQGGGNAATPHGSGGSPAQMRDLTPEQDRGDLTPEAEDEPEVVPPLIHDVEMLGRPETPPYD